MAKTMGVSPITGAIYYGTIKDNMFKGEKEDVTNIAIKAVFEHFIQKLEDECPNGAYQIRFPNLPYVLEMRKEEMMKNYNKDNPPIDCKCGCEATEKKNIVRDKNIGEVEYTLHCKNCGEYLGTFEYGKWSY